MGIKLQLLSGFFIFTVIIVTILWIFQIVLLNPFYESIKKREISQATELLKSTVEDPELLDQRARNIVIEYGMNVRISDHLGGNVLNYWPNEIRSNLISGLDRFTMIDLFNRISASGGSYTEEFTRQRLTNGSDVKGLIMAVTVQIPGGINRLILLETEITPVDSTVDTLKYQLIFITGAMLVLGIALALYIALRISKPIESINNSAKLLASGNYDTEFEEAGSKEVFELAHTLNYAAVELSKVESLRRELLANVSHDLRTPLTMIKGYSEVMRDLPNENNPENAQIIIDEASRLTDLVNDLLDLSRLESGTVTLSKETFNLTKSIEKTLARYEKLTEFEFTFQHDGDVFINADELKISQVVYNLINNAVNYSFENKRITIRQILQKDTVRIEVSDRGEGIPGDKLKDIWERYYKIDKEHKRPQTGTGIGLSIVKNILQLHGGIYGVSSEIGVGSTFWFELPAEKNSENSPQDIAAQHADVEQKPDTAQQKDET